MKPLAMACTDSEQDSLPLSRKQHSCFPRPHKEVFDVAAPGPLDSNPAGLGMMSPSRERAAQIASTHPTV
jgi:hypothetical protein